MSDVFHVEYVDQTQWKLNSRLASRLTLLMYFPTVFVHSNEWQDERATHADGT